MLLVNDSFNFCIKLISYFLLQLAAGRVRHELPFRYTDIEPFFGVSASLFHMSASSGAFSVSAIRFFPPFFIPFLFRLSCNTSPRQISSSAV